MVDELPGEGSAEARLMACDAQALVRAQIKAARQVVRRGCRESTPQFGMTFMPVVDGDLVPGLPAERVRAGVARDIRLLASVCRDEWHLFQFAPPFNGGVGLERLRQLEQADIEKRFRRNLPHHWEQGLDYYRHRVQVHPERGLLDYCSALETDRTFVVPTVRLLDAHADAGGQAWGCRFDRDIHAFGVPLGACHVSDVPLVFGLTDTPAGQLFTGGGEAAAQLSAQVMQAWGRFAHGHDPGWARWSEGRLALAPGGPAEMVSLLDPAGEQLWRQIIAPCTEEKSS